MTQVGLEEQKTKLLDKVAGRLARTTRAKQGVFFVLVGFGTALSAGGALFTDGWTISGATVVAVIGIFMVFVSSWFQYRLGEETDHLTDAFEAMRQHQTMQESLAVSKDLASFYEGTTTIMRSLYLVMSYGRNVIESILTGPTPDEVAAIDTLLEHIRRELQIALGFGPHQIWTIVVYRAEQDHTDGYVWLRCISHERQIKCDVADARRWKEGIGVGGMAFARDDEVAAPDILSPSAKSLFSLNGGHLREVDYVRYRSLLAVPVNVGDDPRPWGVVLASSDQPNHFLVDGEHDDPEAAMRSEALRAFGGLVALVVAGIRNKAHTENVQSAPSVGLPTAKLEDQL